MLKHQFDSSETKRYNDRCTVVTLKGYVTNVPEHHPKDWVYEQSRVNAYDLIEEIQFTVKGKAIRSLDDKDDPVLAERIAESRAKAKLYNFISRLNNEMMKEAQKTLENCNLTKIRYDLLEAKEESHLKELYDNTRK